MKSIFTCLIIILYLFTLSCTQNESQVSKPESWDVKNTQVVESYDEVNKLPIKMAQDSLNIFLDLFSAKLKNNYFFSIKSKYVDGNEIENMWSSVYSMKGDTLFTILNNVPLRLTNVELNDTIKVVKKDIEDWTIHLGDSLVLGHFMKKYRKPK